MLHVMLGGAGRGLRVRIEPRYESGISHRVGSNRFDSDGPGLAFSLSLHLSVGSGFVGRKQ